MLPVPVFLLSRMLRLSPSQFLSALYLRRLQTLCSPPAHFLRWRSIPWTPPPPLLLFLSLLSLQELSHCLFHNRSYQVLTQSLLPEISSPDLYFVSSVLSLHTAGHSCFLHPAVQKLHISHILNYNVTILNSYIIFLIVEKCKKCYTISIGSVYGYRKSLLLNFLCISCISA